MSLLIQLYFFKPSCMPCAMCQCIGKTIPGHIHPPHLIPMPTALCECQSRMPNHSPHLSGIIALCDLFPQSFLARLGTGTPVLALLEAEGAKQLHMRKAPREKVSIQCYLQKNETYMCRVVKTQRKNQIRKLQSI